MNKKLLWWIWIGILTWGIALSLSQNSKNNETKIIENEKIIKKITMETWKKVNHILEISDLCEKWEKAIFEQKNFWEKNIKIKYHCEEDSIKLNWITQLPAIPGIPTWAPLPF